MKKHLIYLGYTGEAHRIALFDENNILGVKLPIKDVPVLTDDLVFLNCTVVEGKPVPNLQGAKVLTSCKDTWKCSKDTTFYDFASYSSVKMFNPQDLWAFEGRVPDFLYQCDLTKNVFSAGELMWKHRYYKVWDGVCSDDNIYVIGSVHGTNAKKLNTPLGCNLCISSKGDVLFLSESGTTFLANNGAVFVQVGTPEIAYRDAVELKGIKITSYATVGIPKDVEDRVIWLRRVLRNKQSVLGTAENVWWAKVNEVSIEDFRRYSRARIFGLNTVGDARVVVYPESTESVWLAALNGCRHLDKVYLPKGFKHPVELGLKLDVLRRAVVYTESEAMLEFCAVRGIRTELCGDANLMLEEHYKSYTTDFLDVEDASTLSALAGTHTDKTGANNTLWSAIHFSAADKSVASTELASRYVVKPTCDLELPSLPLVSVGKFGVGSVSDYARELCRLQAATLTQFYPYSDRKVDSPANLGVIALGDYTLYLMEDVLNQASLKNKEDWERDMYKIHHVFLLQDNATGRVIHRFVGNDMLYIILLNLRSLCFHGGLPSGILRYADKLHRVKNATESTKFFKADADEAVFANELFTTFFPVIYGTVRSKREVLGIDLNTGNIVTFTVSYSYSSSGWLKAGNIDLVTKLAGIWTMSKFKIHKPDEDDLSVLFPNNCVYVIEHK